MVFGESRIDVCNNYNNFKKLLDHIVADHTTIFSLFRNFRTQKRNWEIKLEVSEFEKDLLYKEFTN